MLVDAHRLVHPDNNSTNILIIFDDITDRQRHEAEMTFMIGELRHRMKNLLAVVHGLAMQTEAEGRTASEYRDVFLGRLETTLRAQELAADEKPAPLDSLIKASVGELAAARLDCRGPLVVVPRANIVPLSMIFHELGTNALKYGALSMPHGRIDITWSLENASNQPAVLLCEWHEKNGPPVMPPTRKGYGTELIEGTCTHLDGSVELRYDPAGLTARITIPM